MGLLVVLNFHDKKDSKIKVKSATEEGSEKGQDSGGKNLAVCFWGLRKITAIKNA
jgi:hypothetical protein